MSAPQRLPTFVVIGAVKAATTWVAHQLRCRPGIFMPQAEPHYFSSDYHRGPDWYAGLFEPASENALIGEKSADYLAHPEAPARLAAMLPAARLVVQLRDPVERAYSDYCMLYRRGTVNGDIGWHLSPAGPHARFLNDGLYWQHFCRWMEHFERGQIHTLLYEDVARDPAATLAGVAAHIGVEGRLEPLAPEVRRNDSRAPQVPRGLRRTLAPLKTAVQPFRSQSWFRSLHRRIAREVDYPPLTPELRHRLADHYASDVEALGKFLGRDLASWLQWERRAA